MHTSNFVASGLGVKQHGAILGMQMQRNRIGRMSPRQSVIPGRALARTSDVQLHIGESLDSGFAAGASPRNDERALCCAASACPISRHVA